MSETIQSLELVSNGYPLASIPSRIGRLTATDPHQSRQKLWEQYQAQGYLWLKHFLPVKQVLAFRRRYFQALNQLIAPGTDPAEGIWSGESVPNLNRELAEIVRSAAYESFCLMEPIWQFYEMFFSRLCASGGITKGVSKAF